MLEKCGSIIEIAINLEILSKRSTIKRGSSLDENVNLSYNDMLFLHWGSPCSSKIAVTLNSQFEIEDGLVYT